ncbi:MAG: glutamate synthase large subunit [bacterium]
MIDGENTMMPAQGLYDPLYEHDACGVGFVANIDGEKSHHIVTDGITILKNLMHRGAIGSDYKTGDGAGILCQIPHLFLEKECDKMGIDLPESGVYGVGMFFLSHNKKKREGAISLIEKTVKREGGTILGWRDVPVNPNCLGEIAKKDAPFISQLFVTIPESEGDELERNLYIIRKSIENNAQKNKFTIHELYPVSLSGKTITYKGMFIAPQLEEFYPDLMNTAFQSSLILVHQRFSTNTFPSWPLAQPFRYACHNGEINTLRGNINKMQAREAILSSKAFGSDIKKLLPIIDTHMSDSGILDNVFELLLLSGRSPAHAMMMMIPEAFGSKYHISEDKRAFYEFHAAIMEPWDGPAAVSFTNGEQVGALLDRNGLRPARYCLTKSNDFIMASESGVLDIEAKDILEKGRLGPGNMIIVDTKKKRIIYNNEIKATISRQKPYRRWLENERIELKGLFGVPGPLTIDKKDIILKQHIFGYTLEDITMIIAPMAENAQEPIGSMGNDTPLAVLSLRPQLLYNYFKQLFAQVTNPPIDPYRENLVMSLMSFIGKERNLLDETSEHCRQLKLPHPIVSNDDINKLKHVDSDGLKGCVIPILFDISAQKPWLKEALDSLCHKAEQMVDNGFNIVILSDRDTDETRAPIPALLALSAVHQCLIRKKKRQLTALIIESGEVREVMHFATLIGYGVSAINPYLAFETIANLHENGKLSPNLKLETAFEHYITAIKKGLLKVMSKMGVSTIRSYRGAQLFEALGLDKELIDEYFPGTPSRIGGIGLETITTEICEKHRKCFKRENAAHRELESGGTIHFRRSSEKHLLSPDAIRLIQKSIRTNDYSAYKEYASVINDTNKNLCTLRGLFTFKKRNPIPLDSVEPVESIVKRFVSSAMSFGSISKEAHETIAVAMNRLGAASNSGEGGEDEARYTKMGSGDSKQSKIKQVASARFGVNSNYLINSEELQIKMAQGAKPGEGGQLPGHKVDEVIASVRHSTPGVGLISPPPHHDIYSIEDLAQLIFDLKNANRNARISVKLVSEIGVGTIAAGVAKAKADMVLISGHDGGTGSSPLSSIKHAGIPWEIGLAETQQTLVLNNLRDRIRIQVDGQIKTGYDVVIGALLGAEEFGFGTMSLVSMGCIMMRKCHLNTCPVGVATQNPELRKRFTGKPEYLIRFMEFTAQNTREIMADLGFRTIDEMVGRSDILETNRAVGHWKTKGLDFSKILSATIPEGATRMCIQPQVHDFSDSIDEDLIKKSTRALEKKEPVSLVHGIKNSNRTVGAMLSSEVSKNYGSAGLPADTITCKFNGSAGQSFGAFLAPGITFEIEGDVNDYCGKGLSGGKIIVYPPKESTFRAQNNIIAGNVSLFGALCGEVYINGLAGERFAVRNSGAKAVVEGVGDHGCEYMTGGIVVILGRTGVNFAAGMSGGIAYVLDENQLFDTRCNLETVDIEVISSDSDKNILQALIQDHVKYTGSEYAANILRDWSEMLPRFVKVMPIDYREALARIKEKESKESESVDMTEEVYS